MFSTLVSIVFNNAPSGLYGSDRSLDRLDNVMYSITWAPYFGSILNQESFSVFLNKHAVLIWVWENGNAFGALKSWRENPLWISLLPQ
jgi:hypothetical protein